MQIIGNIIVNILVILFLLCVGLVRFLPFVIGILLSVIIIYLSKKIIVWKDPKLRKTYNIIVIVICMLISITLDPLWYKYASAKPNDTYEKMQELNESQSLIGLSKEQVVELLEDPCGNKDSDKYYYDAGKTTNYIAGGTNDFYQLQIIFDESGKVKSTSINLVV